MGGLAARAHTACRSSPSSLALALSSLLPCSRLSPFPPLLSMSLSLSLIPVASKESRASRGHITKGSLAAYADICESSPLLSSVLPSRNKLLPSLSPIPSLSPPILVSPLTFPFHRLHARNRGIQVVISPRAVWLLSTCEYSLLSSPVQSHNKVFPSVRSFLIIPTLFPLSFSVPRSQARSQEHQAVISPRAAWLCVHPSCVSSLVPLSQ